ncbi:hypothetical protein BV20DRAFT_1053562 [Pilatotrama ljubarskyi]|nr:hypothetical protein BV20DRAFT_1053562 [Pilatotrama ljubarskyi]
MVATFILTRAFAISALFVGAFPITHAAPVPAPAPSVLDTVLIFASRQKHSPPPAADLLPPTLVAQAAKRSCQQQGCLDDEAAPSAASKRADAPDSVFQTSAIVEEPLRNIAVPDAHADDTFVEIETPPRGSAAIFLEPREDAPRRSCHQQGCLREIDGTLEDPQLEMESSELQATSVIPDKNHGDDNRKRSCRQQGCLRELEQGL